MPWIEAMLRGQKVFARVKEDGAFDATGGRVEIRYKRGDARAYRASVSNLSEAPGAARLADDAFPAGEPVAQDKAKADKSDKGGSNDKSGRPAAAKPSRLDTKHSAPTRSADGWLAYTDGACSGNPGPAGAGFVIIHPGGKIDEGYEFLGTSTNNVAELTAILRAVEIIPASAPSILVHTDSQYSIGVLTKGWKAKANQELVAVTKKALANRPQARLAYVPGHAGVPMNERADELAREAIRTRRSQSVVLAT
jgi:ribonuclease HI